MLTGYRPYPAHLLKANSYLSFVNNVEELHGEYKESLETNEDLVDILAKFNNYAPNGLYEYLEEN